MSQPIQATIKSSIELHRTLSPITISSLQITSSEKTHTVAQILVPPIPNLTKTALLQSNKTIQPITARRRTIRNIFRSNRIVLQEMIIHQQLSFSRNPTMNSSTSREISHRMAKGNPVVDSEAITQVEVSSTIITLMLPLEIATINSNTMQWASDSVINRQPIKVTVII